MSPQQMVLVKFMLNPSHDSIKLAEENIGKNLCDTGFSDNCLYMTLKAQATTITKN
jgi:hypothetical protein